MTRNAQYAVIALTLAAAIGMTPAGPAPADAGLAQGAAIAHTAADAHVASDADVAGILARIDAEIAANNPVTLDWKTMAALNYRTGEMSDALRRLNGVQVRVPGFMVPLEDWEEQVTEFLLVPYFGACIHTPPPPPNQMAHVLMMRNRKVAVNLWDPVWVVGTLKIESVESPYGMVGFQLSAESIRPYDG
jgi:uncharacterized protein